MLTIAEAHAAYVHTQPLQDGTDIGAEGIPARHTDECPLSTELDNGTDAVRGRSAGVLFIQLFAVCIRSRKGKVYEYFAKRDDIVFFRLHTSPHEFSIASFIGFLSIPYQFSISFPLTFH